LSRCPREQHICQLCGEVAGAKLHVVFECGGQEVPRQLHAELFEAFGGWSDPSPADLPTDAMRRFMAEDQRWVAT
jgi:hypothetical protein